MNGLGSLIKTIVVSIVLSLTPSLATAGQWSQACEAAGKKAQAACKGASDSAKAADTADASSRMNTSGIKPSAGNLRDQANNQVQRLTQAKSTCEAEKQKCESECQTQESNRKAAANGPPQNPTTQQAKADQGPLEQKKEKECVAALAAMIAPLAAGAGDATKAAEAAKDTGKSSGGMMPLPIPIPLPSDKKGDQSGTAGANPTPDKLNCEAGNSQQYSDCNNHFIEKCQNAPDTAGCAPFISRYCGDYNPTPTPTPTGNDNLTLEAQSTAVTANLVVGKSGEGMGSAFCKKITAYRFCQASGRSQCPSCKNLNSPWPTEGTAADLTAAQQACPTDPMFLDSAAQAALGLGTSTTNASTTNSVSTQSTSRDRTSAGGGGGASGGGISTQSVGGAGGAGTAGGGPEGAVAEGYKGPSLANGSGYAGDGGGGGGGYGGSSSGDEASGPGYKPSSVNGQSDTRNPSATVSARADVGNQYGPNVFSIQSATYRDMCSRGRFLHCGR